jgi:hypothetical protein
MMVTAFNRHIALERMQGVLGIMAINELNKDSAVMVNEPL